jgi:hypothetical protein
MQHASTLLGTYTQLLDRRSDVAVVKLLGVRLAS